MNFFQGLSNYTNSLFLFLDNTTTQNIIFALATLFSISVTIMIILESYKYMLGKSDAPITNLLWDIGLKMVFISIALGYNDFLFLINHSLNDFHRLASGDVSLYVKLDSVFESVINLARETYKSTPNSIGGAFLGAVCILLIYTGFILASASSFMVITIAELTLKILIMLSPFAIYALVYKFSKQIFNQWLNMVISNVFTVLIVGLFVGALANTYVRFQSELLSENSNLDPMAVALQSFFMGIVVLGAVLVSKSIAEKLGTVSIDALSQSALSSQISGSAKSITNLGSKAKETGNQAKIALLNTKSYFQSKGKQ